MVKRSKRYQQAVEGFCIRLKEDYQAGIDELAWQNSLELYNQSPCKSEHASYMQVRIETDVDKAGDAFAVENLGGLQYWFKKLDIKSFLPTTFNIWYIWYVVI